MNSPRLPDYARLFWPVVRYVPTRGRYETIPEAAARLHAWPHTERTITFDLGIRGAIRQQSRQLLRRHLTRFREENPTIKITLQANTSEENEYKHDVKLIIDTRQFDYVILSMQKECDVEAKIKRLSDTFDGLPNSPPIKIIPVLSGSQTLIIAGRLLDYRRVTDVIFDRRDFSLSLGLPLSPGWQPGEYMQLSRKRSQYEGLAGDLIG